MATEGGLYRKWATFEHSSETHPDPLVGTFSPAEKRRGEGLSKEKCPDDSIQHMRNAATLSHYGRLFDQQRRRLPPCAASRWTRAGAANGRFLAAGGFTRRAFGSRRCRP